MNILKILALPFTSIYNIYMFMKLRRELFKEYREDNLVERFSQIFGVQFRVDNIARLYAVVNPLLLNLRDSNSSQIFEYDNEGRNDYAWVHQWVMTKMIAIEPMIAARNLLDILKFNIEQIEVDGKPSGNYLIYFYSYDFEDFEKSVKYLGIFFILLIIVFSVLFGFGIL